MLGHDVGDDMLIAVARRLSALVRPSDTVARLGGDEFVVVCDIESGEEEMLRHQRAHLHGTGPALPDRRPHPLRPGVGGRGLRGQSRHGSVQAPEPGRRRHVRGQVEPAPGAPLHGGLTALVDRDRARHPHRASPSPWSVRTASRDPAGSRARWWGWPGPSRPGVTGSRCSPRSTTPGDAPSGSTCGSPAGRPRCRPTARWRRSRCRSPPWCGPLRDLAVRGLRRGPRPRAVRARCPLRTVGGPGPPTAGGHLPPQRPQPVLQRPRPADPSAGPPLRRPLRRVARRPGPRRRRPRRGRTRSGFNGVEVDRFRGVSTPGRPTGPTVLFLGRHEERKGLGVLLSAFERLRPVGHRCPSPEGQRRPPTLWVAGDGPQTDALRRLHPEAPDIHWLGVLTEEEKMRRLAGGRRRCARRPSAGSRSAWSCSRPWPPGPPVVASDIDGYREAAGGHAVLVPPGDARALARALADVPCPGSLPSMSRGPTAGGRSRERSGWTAGAAWAAHWSMERLAGWYEARYRHGDGPARALSGRTLLGPWTRTEQSGPEPHRAARSGGPGGSDPTGAWPIGSRRAREVGAGRRTATATGTGIGIAPVRFVGRQRRIRRERRRTPGAAATGVAEAASRGAVARRGWRRLVGEPAPVAVGRGRDPPAPDGQRPRIRRPGRHAGPAAGPMPVAADSSTGVPRAARSPAPSGPTIVGRSDCAWYPALVVGVIVGVVLAAVGLPVFLAAAAFVVVAAGRRCWCCGSGPPARSSGRSGPGPARRATVPGCTIWWTACVPPWDCPSRPSAWWTVRCPTPWPSAGIPGPATLVVTSALDRLAHPGGAGGRAGPRTGAHQAPRHGAGHRGRRRSSAPWSLVIGAPVGHRPRPHARRSGSRVRRRPTGRRVSSATRPASARPSRPCWTAGPVPVPWPPGRGRTAALTRWLWIDPMVGAPADVSTEGNLDDTRVRAAAQSLR